MLSFFFEIDAEAVSRRLRLEAIDLQSKEGTK
jgi:hypothetical protein